MELTQEEIQFIKDLFEQKKRYDFISNRNRAVDEARANVAKRYEPELNRLAEEGKVEERKALVEIMVAEADEAERNVAS